MPRHIQKSKMSKTIKNVKKAMKKTAKKVEKAVVKAKKTLETKYKKMTKPKSKKTVKKTKKTKQTGGRVAMPIEYYGGESKQWTDNKNATTAVPLGNNETWNNFKVGEMTLF